MALSHLKMNVDVKTDMVYKKVKTIVQYVHLVHIVTVLEMMYRRMFVYRAQLVHTHLNMD